jgi:glutathione reductase (NADPH)
MPYDFDLFVIGAGSGGVRAAYLGGTCVNVGCVPKKLMVYSAQVNGDLAHAEGYGWTLGERSFDWHTLIANKNREIERLNGIYRNLLVNSGVTLLEGHARMLDAHTVHVNGLTFSAERILLATGGSCLYRISSTMSSYLRSKRLGWSTSTNSYR